ncbi:MAG: glutamine amidotransferase, partial [Erysipelotrichaceae bacterium]|nr:glutamine amidotransferase [Erysipelotrichaceae bacterium]
MKIKVCWMYHDIMDLYGDKGNILTLQRRCTDRNIGFELETCAISQKMDLNAFDLVFLGGGADKEQLSLIPDLLQRKENIYQALEDHTFFLLICGGYQLFGQYYISADHEKIEGLKINSY